MRVSFGFAPREAGCWHAPRSCCNQAPTPHRPPRTPRRPKNPLRCRLARGSWSARWRWTSTIRRRNDPDAKELTFSTHDRQAPGMMRSTSGDQRLLFVRAQPPGEYEITHLGAGTLTRLAWLTIPGGSMRVTVASDSITYIGDWGGEGVRRQGLHSRHPLRGRQHGPRRRRRRRQRPAVPRAPGPARTSDPGRGTVLPAPGPDAEAEGRPVSDSVPFRDVAALKAAGNIVPAVFAKLEAFHPSTAPVSATYSCPSGTERRRTA